MLSHDIKQQDNRELFMKALNLFTYEVSLPHGLFFVLYSLLYSSLTSDSPPPLPSHLSLQSH